MQSIGIAAAIRNSKMTNGDSDSPPDSQETLAVNSDSAPAPSMGPRRIRNVGDYELMSEIARGGMGIVYRAKQLSLNRTVAVKVIRSAEYATDLDRLRFRSEAEAAANLDHPNIVPIYEVGEHAGEPYFSMRLIEGGSLADSIRLGHWHIDKPDSSRRATKLVEIVARAVHAAHQYGILHRDLKPGNILLDASETPFVTDFGLAKRVESETPGLDNTHVTQTGEIVGTPAFMPPEQALGKKGLTTATDVYSLGAILYTLLAGRTPFQSESPLDLLQQVVSNPAPTLRKLNSKVDLDLETICQKCLEKEPVKRYSSALSLAEDLERWSRGEPITARPVSLYERLVRWGKRHPTEVAMWATAVGAIGLVVLILGIGYTTAIKQANEGRRRIYLHDMTNAFQSIEAGQHAEAFRLLVRHDYKPEQSPDFRDWEWSYLRNQCRLKMHFPARGISVGWSHQLTRCTVLDYPNKRLSIGTIEQFDIPKEQPIAAKSSITLLSNLPFSCSTKTVLNNYDKGGTGEWDNNGDRYAMLNSDGVGLVSAASYATEWQTKHSSGDAPSRIRWNQANSLLAVGTVTGFVDVFDAEDGRLIRSFECRDSMEGTNARYAFGFGSDDRWIAIGSRRGIRFLDPVTGSLIRKTDWSMNDLSLDGRWIGSEFGIRDSQSGEMVAMRKEPQVREWSLDGTTCVERSGTTYRVFHNDFDTPEFEFQGYLENISRTALSFDGSTLIEEGHDGHYLWDIRSRRDTRDWAKPSDTINAISLRNDGSMIAFAEQGDESSVHIYDGQTFADLGTIRVGEHRVLSVAAHPKLPQVATLDELGTLQIWNTESLEKITQLKGISAKSNDRSDSYWKVVYSADGMQLAAGGGGDRVILWETSKWNEQNRIEGADYRFAGWFKQAALIQATNRPALKIDTSTSDFQFSNLLKGKSPFSVTLPNGLGKPPRDDVSHILYLDARIRWSYMPFEFDASRANRQKDGGLFELNSMGFQSHSRMSSPNYSNTQRRFDLTKDRRLVLAEMGSDTRIGQLSGEINRTFASSDRSAIVVDGDKGIKCFIAKRNANPLSFSLVESSWPRWTEPVDIIVQGFAVSLYFLFPLFAAMECFRKRLRLGIALTVAFLFCLFATSIMPRIDFQISNSPHATKILLGVGLVLVGFPAVPCLLKIAHLVDVGHWYRLWVLLVVVSTPALIYSLWTIWPTNDVWNASPYRDYRGSFGILIIAVWLVSVFLFHRWMGARTHRDLHENNPLLFEFCRGTANRTEAWLGLLGLMVLTLPMLILCYEPSLSRQIWLAPFPQPWIRAAVNALGIIGICGTVTQSIVMFFVYRFDLMRPEIRDDKE